MDPAPVRMKEPAMELALIVLLGGTVRGINHVVRTRRGVSSARKRIVAVILRYCCIIGVQVIGC